MAVEGSNIDTSAARSFDARKSVTAFRAHHPVVDRVVTTLTDRPDHTLRGAGKSLAEGRLGAWAFFTDGLIVNGTFPGAVNRLLQAKGIPQELIDKGQRPVVSVLPDKEHRAGLIDVSAHTNPAVIEALQGNDMDLLTDDGDPLFYRVFAGDASYLKPPLVQIDERTGRPTLVLLWHNNHRLKRLEERLRQFAPDQDVLLTGSSANITKEDQPANLRQLDPRIKAVVDFTVNARDGRVHHYPEAKRGSIPIIDLTTEVPTVKRASDPGTMYDAMPRHPGLRALLHAGAEPIRQ